MSKGVIYILTNPSFPEYVKIGYANNLEKRLEQLNRSECIPFAFRVYATYEVEERLSDLKVHSLIDTLNPDLRSIETVDGKKRVREFYAISPSDAYSIFKTIAELGGRMDRLKLYEMTEKEREEEETAQEIEDITYERRSPFSFSKCGIKPGENVVFSDKGNIHSGEEYTVLDDKNVNTKAGPSTLSKLASMLTNSKWGVAGPRYFKYNGRWLNEIRAEKEGRSVRNRIEDTWVIPCNPEKYDVINAFKTFKEIEWSQSTNMEVGDTVFIYVAGEFHSIMFKASVISVDNFGKGSEKDKQYYKVYDGKERRYMILRLVESYEKDQFPLNELRANGLKNVQGKSRVTPELSNYLNSKE